ncbi:hypothetical protein [Burkholderia ambifaria]|jgi:hypothetical protein|uniref:hypothetical protein n=1 Tax=Burkholderia ambifaria TaxID=152480 RepID=UPI0011B20666|nr:hypothetical protein [Burkholderia ambifaria]
MPGKFVWRRGSSNTVDRDAEFKTAVFERRLVIYVDEWDNKRTMEARVYGAAPSGSALIGFQIDADRGVVPAQLWKMIDDLDRVVITKDAYEWVDRTVPSQYAGQLIRFDAVSPDTALDMTKHAADGY